MKKVIAWLVCLIVLSSCGGIRNLKKETVTLQQQLDTSSYILQEFDTLSRSPYGNWQLRLSGDAFALGYKRGKLTQQLYQNQEKVFFEQVAHFVPKPKRQKFLLRFLKWYHRDILEDIPWDYRQEIYALSRFAGDEYDFLGSKYERGLLLHGAHDIGHAMQDLMLVGCSSLAFWDGYTADGNLLIGRNFDFYVNEAFSENKVVEFISPDKGYKYASVSWPGMIGVVSGMNEKGLTVTLNAGKSSIPLKGRTPIAIVARDILQHAQNIDEAIKIAQSHHVFISESILVGSDQDNKAVNIEISPKKFDVYEVENGKLLCTNHFQSEIYAKDRRNLSTISNSHTNYRLEKLRQVTEQNKTYAVDDVLAILRDVTGLDSSNIGLGNEKSLNQLLAHHAVIFKPKDRIMWVSNNPYQLGTFEAYDLKKIFNTGEQLVPVSDLALDADTLIESVAFKNYLSYKKNIPHLQNAIRTRQALPEETLESFASFNSELWATHQLLGDYYQSQKDWDNAAKYYEIALTKEISSEKARKEIQKKLRKVNKKR